MFDKIIADVFSVLSFNRLFLYQAETLEIMLLVFVIADEGEVPTCSIMQSSANK